MICIYVYKQIFIFLGKNVKIKEELKVALVPMVYNNFNMFPQHLTIYFYDILNTSKPRINICFHYSGFGTCCTVVLEEGGSSSLNQTYMVQASTTSLATGPMTYRICPCSDDVCRIRFDFTVSHILCYFLSLLVTFKFMVLNHMI